MTITMIQPAGYVVADNELIYATGASADEAWTAMLDTMAHAGIHVIEDREFRSAKQEAEDEAIQDAGPSWAKASSLQVRGASACLIAEVADKGGAIGWHMRNGVACTRAEHEGE